MNIITIKYIQITQIQLVTYNTYIISFKKNMVNHTHKHIHHDQSELIQFYDKTIGVVRICNLTNVGLKAICLGYNVRVNAQFQVLQHIAFSLASCDAF